MGTRAFDDLLASTTAHIDTMSDAVGILEMFVARLTARAEGDGPEAGEAALSLEEIKEG